MNKGIKYSFFVVLALCVCYMAAALIANNNYIYSHVNNYPPQEITSVEVKTLDENVTEYWVSLDAPSDDMSMALEFWSSHQYVTVYVDDTVIYSIDTEPSIFGRTTGSPINIVMLPVHTTNVRIVTTPVFGKVNNSIRHFYYGDAVALYRKIIKSSLFDVVLCTMIVELGMAMVLYWFLARKRVGQSSSIAYFGVFAILMGLWTLNETDMIVLLLNNRTSGSMIGYVLLMLLAVPFIMFVRRFFEIKDEIFGKIICIVSIVETIVLTILHMTDIVEFKQSVIIIHATMVVGLGYMIAVVIVRIRQNGFDRKVRINIIAAIALSLSIVADFTAYYMGVQQTDVIGKIGILIYIILLGKESAQEVFKKVEEGRKAEFYQKLAVTDVMTGLLNRSAYEEWQESCSDYRDVMIVTFDLNNLKLCNDNLGHSAGDVYIVEAAHMIKRVFGSVAKCYRIGGDEFCAVIRKSSRISIDKYLAKLKEEQEHFNQKSDDVKINIAVGYAVYESLDGNFEETRNRADVFMYRNKKNIKENGV